MELPTQAQWPRAPARQPLSPELDSRLSPERAQARKILVDYPRAGLDPRKKIVDYLQNALAAEKR